MKDEALKLALEALKELVAQTEGSLFAVKHDPLLCKTPEKPSPPPAQPAPDLSGLKPASRVLSGQELTEYQINHKRESEEYMASLNKYLPVIGALAQIESKK